MAVVAMRDTPRPPVDIPTCLGRSVRHSWYPGGTCELDRSAALSPAVFEAERAAAYGLPNVHFLDMTDQLCDRQFCWAVKNGIIVYRDDNHITGSFAASLSPVLEAKLVPLVLSPRQ
jgi:hypothetical protein